MTYLYINDKEVACLDTAPPPPSLKWAMWADWSAAATISWDVETITGMTNATTFNWVPTAQNGLAAHNTLGQAQQPTPTGGGGLTPTPAAWYENTFAPIPQQEAADRRRRRAEQQDAYRAYLRGLNFGRYEDY